jgi:hypothetical protein
MKIEIFLRHCFYSPNSALPNRHRPSWYDKEKVFQNFKRTLNIEACNYTIIYDKHYGPRDQTFLKTESNVVECDCGNEAGSFIFTLNYIKDQNYDPNTIIYFLEDDYLHLPGWEKVMVEAFALPIHYMTLYDHLDKYLNYPDLYSKIYCTESCHWRTVPSTCNTYATKYTQLMQDYHTHEKYSVYSDNGISRDNDKFLDLGGQGRSLISSMPGYSTQCDLLQSPTINWEQHL